MTEVKSDIEIARAARKKPILEIGAALGIPPEDLLPYGHDKAKIGADFIARQQDKKNGFCARYPCHQQRFLLSQG